MQESGDEKKVEVTYVDDSKDPLGEGIKLDGDVKKRRQRNWTFTLFYDDAPTADGVVKAWTSAPNFRGLMYEHEVCPKTHKPHLQGFICFDSIKSLAMMKLIHNTAHWEAMGGSIEENNTYCSKEKNGTVIVYGVFPASAKEKGERGKAHGPKGATHGAKAPNLWDFLVSDIKGGMSKREVMEKYVRVVWGCEKSLDRYFDEFAPKPTFDIVAAHGSYFPWQQQLLDVLAHKADNRSVVWIYSPEGGVGKSDMFKHLVWNCGFEPLMNAPSRDLACAWKGGHVVFDLARDLGDAPINYGFMEQVKNGFAFSAKYESRCKIAASSDPRWVICFANQLPDTSKLSRDRWALFRVVDNMLSWEDA